MTVLVGVLCDDGVVLGSDSSATFGPAPNMPTIEQPIQKTFLVGDDVIFAGTGEVGLGQRFKRVLDHLRQESKGWESGDPIEISKAITANVRADFQATSASPEFGALVAYASQGRPHLCEFALHTLQPEQKAGDKTWFASMGGGQLITDPFLGFLRSVFFPDSKPSVRDGIFLTTWALEHAIELNAGGIDGPVQIGVLEQTDGQYKARMIEGDELGQHRQSVESAKAHLATYAAELTTGDIDDVPAPPALPDVGSEG